MSAEPKLSPPAGRGSVARIPAWMLAVAAMFAIQLANGLSAGVTEQIGAAGTAWLRMCFAGLLLGLIARPPIRSLRRADLLPLLALGAATGFMMTFLLAAVERIPLGTAVAIEVLGPLTVAGVMAPRRSALAWPAIAFVGVVVLTEPWQGELDLIGIGFALAAGACWAVYNLLTQHVGDRFSGVAGLALTLPIAALATLPAGLPQVIAGGITWWLLAAVAGIAVIAPALALGLEMLALRRMNHTAFGTLLSIEPAFGLLLGLILLGQTPTLVQLTGMALVIGAGAAAQRGGGRSPDPDDPTRAST